MEIRKGKLEAANKRAAKRLEAPRAVSARYDGERVVIELSNSAAFMFDPRRAQGLEKATPEDLADIEISPSGLGLYFPALDADLYVPSLLEGIFGSRRWMAATMGKAGGMAKSAAKASASRENGRLGGRPRKRRQLEPAG